MGKTEFEENNLVTDTTFNDFQVHVGPYKSPTPSPYCTKKFEFRKVNQNKVIQYSER